MEPQRYLRCLGQPALFAPNGEPVRFRTKKHLALLVYLSVDARSHRRERLAEFLWPCGSLVEARHSLATALSILRPRVGRDALETSREHVRLLPGRIALDLQRLQAGDILGTEVTGPLEVAAFLDNFDVPDSTEFTHWKDGQQARLLPLIKDALVVLIDRCRRTGDSRQIEQLADRMLALDDLSEQAIRAKMEARAFAGDRLTALQIFEGWKTKLAEELQALPSDLVEGMAVRLRRRGWERTTLTNIPNVPTDQWRGRRFIGRTAEYRVLYEAWEGIRKGVAGHVLVLGDSGVGKSTLVERLTTAAGLEGAAISRVQCYDLEREIPYSTISGLVLGLLDRPGVSATPSESLAELARTVPEVRHRFPAIPPSSDSQGESARIRLTEAFHDMLVAVAEEHPVILVVDDLHLADDVSLAVLHLMMRRARGQAIMVLLVARPGELPQSPQAEKLRGAGAALGMREMELLPLTEPESLELLHSLIPDDQPRPGQAVQRALLKGGAGYPMVLELLVQDWQTSGEQSLALSVDAMTTDPGSGGPAAGVYREILDRITRSLDPITHNVLNLASILGQRLSDPSMYRLVDLSVGQTMSAMTELVRRRVLRDGARGLEFVNEMVRASAYVGVPAPLRKVLHGKIVDHLVSDHERGTDDVGLEIAWHCMRAGRSPEATSHLLQGARAAIRAGAPFGAERGLVTALPNLAEADRPSALLLLVEALQEQSRWEESLVFLRQLEEQQGRNSNGLAFVLTARANRRLGFMDSVQQAELLVKLLPLIEAENSVTTQITAAVEAASVVDEIHGSVHTDRLLAAVTAIDENIRTDEVARLLLAKSMVFYSVQDLGSSLKCVRKAVDIMRKHDAPSSVLAMLQNGLGAILTRLGKYGDSITAFTEASQTGARIGNDQIFMQVQGNLALSFARLGDYTTAVNCADQALGPADTGGAARLCLTAMRGALIAHAMLRNTTRAERLLRRGAEMFSGSLSPGSSQAWYLYAADGFALLGRQHEAEQQALRATTGEFGRVHATFYVGPYARWLARISVLLHQVQAGHERLDALIQDLGRYDAIDQVELLCAKRWLCAQTDGMSSEYMELIESRLSELPAAVREQLQRMEMVA